MGSLIVKLDNSTTQKLKNIHHFDDIDLFKYSANEKNLDVDMLYDVDAVKQSIRNILTWRVGESILHPEFGHRLKQSMYSQMDDTNRDVVCSEIQRAIEKNEPRVEIKQVFAGLDEDSDQTVLKVNVIYQIKGDKTSDATMSVETTISGK